MRAPFWNSGDETFCSAVNGRSRRDQAPADTRSGAGRSAHINELLRYHIAVWLVLGLPDGLRRHDSPQQGCTEWTAGGSERSRPGSTSASTATGLSKLPNVLGPLRTVDRCAHRLILLEARAWPSRWASQRPSWIIPFTRRGTESDDDFKQGPGGRESWAVRPADENVVV